MSELGKLMRPFVVETALRRGRGSFLRLGHRAGNRVGKGLRAFVINRHGIVVSLRAPLVSRSLHLQGKSTAILCEKQSQELPGNTAGRDEGYEIAR